ncbi:uncharacterized protein A1O9_04676 [Exophiala aquamarina CBS 119918]|uniref:NDT80 domain-containing protein n=1 Tax=Exophiala aquamarina CBS 119918 TaxID=1182545 RepID=A0A072PKJ0_9EURO|nr:uncharacterized protein A1O9_04676 [Exophiala aquamarina CBS 119918]KEF59828.1 hypothetical protein A1O9_04676 [Exophiala aquamarina CBS 119918]
MSSSFHENTPRASQEGPLFGDTHVIYPVMNAHNQQLMPEISATIQKGFFQVEHKWTCYRRNYFAVACSFSFKSPLAEGPYYLNRNGQREMIHQFAVSISAKTASASNGESETRGLVQHTPKRDKATESVPGRHQISPMPHSNAGSNGVYHGSSSLYQGGQHIPSAIMSAYIGYDNGAANSVPTNHTFERIQFQKATANNGKRRAQQQYFLVVVELSASVARARGDESWVVIATKESDPMVVRGRSPGHYKDNGRRDSESNMDPGRGSGPGGDGAPGGLALPPYGGGHSSMDWQSTQRQSGSYGASYRQAMKTEFSPANTLAGTPTEAELSLSDSQTVKSSCTFSTEQSVMTPLSEASDEALFNLDHHTESRKRPYEDEDEEDQLRFHHNAPFTDSISTLADLSATPWSKLLCAPS